MSVIKTMHIKPQLSIVIVIAITVFSMTSLMFSTTLYASGGILNKIGIVYTRGLVTGPNDKPIFAEFDAQGEATAIGGLPNKGEAVGELLDAKVMAGDIYRAIAKAYKDFKTQHDLPQGIARGATVMTREKYISYQANSETIKVLEPNGVKSTYNIPKPDLNKETKSVYVRNHKTIVDPRFLPKFGAQRGTILFEAPIDLRDGHIEKNLPNDIQSVLLNKDGDVKYKSKLNIGFRTAFVKPEDGGIGDPADDNSLKELRKSPIKKLWGPIQGAKVDSAMSHRKPTYSDEDGKFKLRTRIPPCPGFFWIYDYDITAWLSYKTFDPADTRPTRYYPFSGPTFDVCSGFGDIPLGGGLAGLMTTVALKVADSNLNLLPGIIPTRILVDVLLFNGDAKFSNDGKEAIQIAGATEYEYEEPAGGFNPSKANNLDLDGDRELDREVLTTDPVTGEQVIDVYLGATDIKNGKVVDTTGKEVTADLQRLPDYQADFKDRGLLKTISLDDFKNTDMYIYRVSTGKLITERKEMEENVFEIEKEGRFFYRILIPGPRGFQTGISIGGTIEAAQRERGLAEELIGFKTDFLRAGEEVKIIAVNRATGYMDSVTTKLDSSKNGDSTKKYAQLDFPIDQLVLRPPNLRIKSERMYTVTKGSSKGKTNTYQVGYEGSGLTTDTYIKVTSDWLDHDGTPLPDDLPPFNGRLAKVVGNNQLGGNSVSFFEIKPGTYTQLVKLEGDILGTEHFYVHVVADPLDADFSEFGAAPSGPLQYRPKRYVPLRVPILDEAATRDIRNSTRYLLEENYNNNVTDPNAPSSTKNIPAVYRWPYRPEMQFSVYDLKVYDIYRESHDDIRNVSYDIENITSEENKNGTFIPLGDPMLSSSDQLLVVFDLLKNANEPLPYLGPPQSLVFEVGGYEQKISEYGANLSMSFDELNFLDKLNLVDYVDNKQIDDYLVLRLYQDTDIENVLWEFEFGCVVSRTFLTVELDKINKELEDEPTDILEVVDTGVIGGNKPVGEGPQYLSQYLASFNKGRRVRKQLCDEVDRDINNKWRMPDGEVTKTGFSQRIASFSKFAQTVNDINTGRNTLLPAPFIIRGDGFTHASLNTLYLAEKFSDNFASSGQKVYGDAIIGHEFSHTHYADNYTSVTRNALGYGQIGNNGCMQADPITNKPKFITSSPVPLTHVAKVLSCDQLGELETITEVENAIRYAKGVEPRLTYFERISDGVFEFIGCSTQCKTCNKDAPTNAGKCVEAVANEDIQTTLQGHLPP